VTISDTALPWVLGVGLTASTALGALLALADALGAQRPPTDQDRISELARTAVDARLELHDAIRDACPKPHAYAQHRDHQPAWCKTCGRGDNGVVYGSPREVAS
jgi:hypothetical protein